MRVSRWPALGKRICIAAVMLAAVASGSARAQSVCLPAPRLLTTMPMGGQAGTEFEVNITGENLDDAEELLFSAPGITAVPVVGADGVPVQGRYQVTVAADCPVGICDARVMTRLGISSSRTFNVSHLPEQIREQANTSVESAMPLPLNTVCNATTSAQAVDYYTFEATAGQRIAVTCAAKGIDSRLNAVFSVADAAGNDLHVERRGRPIDFTAAGDGRYLVKVHDLTYKGGPHFFYRLSLTELAADAPIPQPAVTSTVSSFSWPPAGLADDAEMAEAEPNNSAAEVQQISLPCDLSGRFYPAADVDVFEFTAKKGDVWWVEVASARLGLPTDPSIVVQHISGEGENETQTDLVELNDIASPVKVSTNNYSYDGPPYNAGSSDILGRMEIKEDGRHRLQLLDLFGGTRSDPHNQYRLVIRKAAPDFALVSWALHMNLRNGDRNALSKPIALRGGSTMPIEVVTIRRDGFDGAIELSMDNLPEGVSATGITIPPGKSRGIMLITADEDAPRGMSSAAFVGTADINGETVQRRCHLASMEWPVPNAWSDIPSPRLLDDVPVSVCGSELAPLTIAAEDDRVWEAEPGQEMKIPLRLTKRCDFSGASISLKTFGCGFDYVPGFEAALDAESSEAVLQLAAQNTPPGDYMVAFYGSAVAKYRHNLASVSAAEAVLNQAKAKAAELTGELEQLNAAAATAAEEEKEQLTARTEKLTQQQQEAGAAVEAAQKHLAAVENRATPKDIVDIIVSRPIRIRVTPPAEEQE